MIIEITIASITLLLFGGIMLYSDLRCIKARREYTALELERFYASVDVENSERIIHMIIKEEIELYKIHNIEYSDIPYIKNDMMVEMIKKVTADVYVRMSEEVRYHMRIAYNVSEEEDIITRLGDLVSLEVMAYAIETNTPH